MNARSRLPNSQIVMDAYGCTAPPGMSFTDFLRVTMSSQLAAMRGIYADEEKAVAKADPELNAEFAAQVDTPEKAAEYLDKVKCDLYDAYNTAASSVLSMFAPEIEMRPDLTVDAIIAAENKILDETDDPETYNAYINVIHPESTDAEVVDAKTDLPAEEE